MQLYNLLPTIDIEGMYLISLGTISITLSSGAGGCPVTRKSCLVQALNRGPLRCLNQLIMIEGGNSSGLRLELQCHANRE